MRKQLRRTVGSSIGGLWGDEPDGGHDDIQVVRVADFDYARLSVTDTIPTRRKIDAGLAVHRLLRAGDLLLEKSGGGEKQNVGRAVLWPGGEPAVSSNFISVLRPAPAHDPRFLTYLHRALYVAGHANACTKQTTGIQNLDLAAYLSTYVHVPTHREQQAIADFLDVESERLAALDKACSRLTGVAADSLGTWFEEQPELRDAEDVALSRLLSSLSDGPFGSALASEHYVEDEQVRVVRLGNVGRAEFRDEDRAFVSHEYGRELDNFLLGTGDVVIAGLGDDAHPLGRACVVPDSALPAVHKADCFRAVVRTETLRADYLAWALSFGRAARETVLLARGSTRSRLNTGVVKSIRLPVPTLSHQVELVQRGEDQRMWIRRLCHRAQELSGRLAEYRDALTTEAVTGQLDVTRVSDAHMDERAHAAMEGEPLEAVR